jgi:hypothetical protein
MEEKPKLPKQPKNETVRIALPPKPSQSPTIKLPPLPKPKEGVIPAPGAPVATKKEVLPPPAPLPHKKEEKGPQLKKFNYEAMDSRGKETKGTLTLRNQNEVVERLKEMGFFPTKVIEVGEEIKKEELEEESRKEKTARLKKTIEDKEKIIREKGEREKEILVRLAEIRGEPTETLAPEQKIQTESELDSLREELEEMPTEGNPIKKWWFNRKRKKLEQEISRLEELEKLEQDKEKNPFKYHLLDKLHPVNFKVLFGENRPGRLNLKLLEEINHVMGEDGKNLEFWNRLKRISDDYDCAVYFYSNGFYQKLKNKNETPKDDKGALLLYDPKARYEIHSPDGKVIADNCSLGEGKGIFDAKAKEYQEQQLAEFEAKNKKQN